LPWLLLIATRVGFKLKQWARQGTDHRPWVNASRQLTSPMVIKGPWAPELRVFVQFAE